MKNDKTRAHGYKPHFIKRACEAVCLQHFAIHFFLLTLIRSVSETSARTAVKPGKTLTTKV